MQTYFAPAALLPNGMAENVRFVVGDDGRFARIDADASSTGAETLAGPVLPGMPNLHSHAFQRAMAGLAERAGPKDDSFWTWRETMYGFAARLSPEDLEAIATELYVEMLKAGYTAVAEFHYVHRDPQGRPYGRPTELSDRIVAAANTAGIGLTHLPVLYGYSGFGAKPPTEGQRRFILDPDAYLRLIADLRAAHRGPLVEIGAAPHSLRAVTPDTLGAVLAGLAPDAPVHIHIAEQTKEVEDCLAWSGQRPVAWLLAHHAVNERWCLVHATHLSDSETRDFAASGAVAGLCPTTEANLGDGLFPLVPFLADRGAIGVGSDSNVSVDPVEELRWLEYGQRLILRKRNVAETSQGASVGRALWSRAAAGGAAALGQKIGALRVGLRADLVVLDPKAPALVGRSGDASIDSFVFAGARQNVRDVMVGGRFVVREGRHPEEERALAGYRRAIARLAA
jgi:formimidoylglutamate deiminase